jgi:hypothetical protein
MAIKKKTDETATASLPPKLDRLLRKGFTEQFLSAKYEDEFKATKAEAKLFIEGSEDVELTIGTSLKSPYGSIVVSERTNISIDKDALIAMVEAGEIEVAQILSCVSTFKNEELEKTLSSAVFAKVASKSNSETFTWKATSDFKAKCAEEYDAGTEVNVAIEVLKTLDEKPKPVAKPAANKVAAARAKAAAVKGAKKPAKVVKVDAASDLDSILGEE